MDHLSASSEDSDSKSFDENELPDHLKIEELKEEEGWEGLDMEYKQPSNPNKMEIESPRLKEQESNWEEINYIPILEKAPSFPPKITLRETLSPFNLFQTLIGTKLFDHLVLNTNNHAQNFMNQEDNCLYMEQHPESRCHRWRNTNVQEMMKFIAMLLSMALSHRNNIKDHWESSPCFPSIFPTIMPLQRFQLLDKFLEINAEQAQEDRSMAKVAPLLKLLSEFTTVYRPSSNLCIDETIAPFTGRFKYLTYNPQKPTKWGIRIIGMADSDNGFCLSLVPQLGEQTYRFMKVKNLNELIIELMKTFASRGSALYIDNYYCNFTLAEQLVERGFHVTGTFRLFRADVPDFIETAIVKKPFKKKGMSPEKPKKNKVETKEIRYFRNNKGVYAFKWKDKREVTLLTTNHSMEFSVKNTARGREVTRPEVIHKYIQYMRGIDRLNQKVHYIRYSHGSNTWWKKFFYTWLAICIANCHVIYTRFFHKTITIKEFQHELINGLLNNSNALLKLNNSNAVQTPPVNIMNNHYPVKLEKGWPKRCKVCYFRTRDPVGPKSSYKCYQCSEDYGKEICLCILCFKDFHDNRALFTCQKKRFKSSDNDCVNA